MTTPKRTVSWLAWSALFIGVVLLLAFSVRAWHQWQFDARVRSGEVVVDSVRGWMTLPYLAQVYRVPEAALRQAIGAPAEGHPERSLRQWFDALGLDPVHGRQAIEQLVLAGGAAGTSASSPAP